MPKIFVIGFNKTCTTTFHHIFMENGLKSYHKDRNFMNNIDKYDCFSDGGEKEFVKIYKQLYEKYPDAFFVLNTRLMSKWLLSRLKHGFMNDYYKNVIIKKRRNPFTFTTWCYPPSKDKVVKWMNTRVNYYLDLIQFMTTKKSNLIILSTDEKDWIPFICEKLNLKKVPDTRKNVHDSGKLSTEMLDLYKYLIDEGFKETKFKDTIFLEEYPQLNVLISKFPNNLNLGSSNESPTK